jgi:hypothetical protein
LEFEEEPDYEYIENLLTFIKEKHDIENQKLQKKARQAKK